MTNINDRYVLCAESKENMSHAKFPFTYITKQN